MAVGPVSASASTLSQTSPLAPKRAGELGQAVEVLAAVPFGRRPGAQIPRIRWPNSLACLKTLNSVSVGEVGDVLQLQPVAEVGPVAAEPLHHVVVLEPGQRQRELLAAELPGHGGDQGLHAST